MIQQSKVVNIVVVRPPWKLGVTKVGTYIHKNVQILA